MIGCFFPLKKHSTVAQISRFQHVTNNEWCCTIQCVVDSSTEIKIFSIASREVRVSKNIRNIFLYLYCISGEYEKEFTDSFGICISKYLHHSIICIADPNRKKTMNISSGRNPPEVSSKSIYYKWVRTTRHGRVPICSRHSTAPSFVTLSIIDLWILLIMINMKLNYISHLECGKRKLF